MDVLKTILIFLFLILGLPIMFFLVLQVRHINIIASNKTAFIIKQLFSTEYKDDSKDFNE